MRGQPMPPQRRLALTATLGLGAGRFVTARADRRSALRGSGVW
jgi:hypothetical protein